MTGFRNLSINPSEGGGGFFFQPLLSREWKRGLSSFKARSMRWHPFGMELGMSLKPVKSKSKPVIGKSIQTLLCLRNVSVIGLNAKTRYTFLKISNLREFCMVGGPGVPPIHTKLSCLSDF